jgi:hypothetical protein
VVARQDSARYQPKGMKVRTQHIRTAVEYLVAPPIHYTGRERRSHARIQADAEDEFYANERRKRDAQAAMPDVSTMPIWTTCIDYRCEHCGGRIIPLGWRCVKCGSAGPAE